jgi:transposase
VKDTIARRAAEITSDTLIVGIDMARRAAHAAVFVTQDGQRVSRLSFHTTSAGFAALKEGAEAAERRVGAQRILVGIEPAGSAWRLLAQFLDRAGIPYRLVNSFTLRRQREGDDLHHRKSDYRDAEMVAQMVRDGRYLRTQRHEGPYARLMVLQGEYRRQQNLLYAETNTLLDLVGQLFPEFQAVFKDVLGVTARAVLRAGLTPAKMARLPLTALRARVRRAAEGRQARLIRLSALQEAARGSVGLRDEAGELVHRVQQVLARVDLLLMQCEVSRRRLTAEVMALPEGRRLAALPGLGPVLAAGLLAEAGPLTRFSNIKQLPKLAGVIPVEHQSGMYRGRYTPMGKKGRPGLRWVCYRAALSLLRHNEVFREAYQRWTGRAERPLTRMEALGACMHKLLRVAYALARQGAGALPATSPILPGAPVPALGRRCEVA